MKKLISQLLNWIISLFKKTKIANTEYEPISNVKTYIHYRGLSSGSRYASIKGYCSKKRLSGNLI